jgi:histone acetyltransferase (RNA polymerase elongator complex component)
VIDQTYPDEVIVIASNVPVDATRRSVSVTLYKGAIAYVSLGNAGDMVPAIEAKYGTNFTTSRKEEKVGVTNIHHFQDPADPAMELTVSQFTVAANGAIFYSVNYACKAVYTEVERAREAYAKAAAPK